MRVMRMHTLQHTRTHARRHASARAHTHIPDSCEMSTYDSPTANFTGSESSSNIITCCPRTSVLSPGDALDSHSLPSTPPTITLHSLPVSTPARKFTEGTGLMGRVG